MRNLRNPGSLPSGPRPRFDLRRSIRQKARPAYLLAELQNWFESTEVPRNLVSSASSSEIVRLLRHMRTEALTIQERQLPAGLCHLHGVECLTLCNRCGRPGGDFLDLRPSNSDEIMVGLGNVAADGVAGPILISGLQATLRAMGSRDLPLPEIAGELNRMLWDIAPEATTATLFCARVRPLAGQLSYINAGQPAALVLRADGTSERLETNAAMLALSRNSKYAQRTARFQPGDTLIAATEGAEEGVLQVLRDSVHGRSGDLPARVIQAAGNSVTSHPADRTAIVLHYGHGQCRPHCTSPEFHLRPLLTAAAAA